MWIEEGHLRCPADKLLRRGESRRINSSLYVIYRASAADCQDCPLWTAASRTPYGKRRGTERKRDPSGTELALFVDACSFAPARSPSSAAAAVRRAGCGAAPTLQPPLLPRLGSAFAL